MTALVITATLGFMILLILIDTYRSNAKIKRMVRESWGEPPVQRFQTDRLESVDTYWERKKLRLGHARYIDDITWNDLDMNLIFAQLNSTFSSVGAEYMYARLHELCFDQAELQAFDELMGALDMHAVEREQIAFRLGKLGKNDFNGVSDFIFAPSDQGLTPRASQPISRLWPSTAFAQSIYTCLAAEFKLRPSLVLTSIAVRDNVAAGDSYFIAEIKSLRRILRSLSAEVPCLCFIDEILKGTNTIERIAASASILGWLDRQNCLCVVASHDIELTEILSGSYDNFHFREQITDEGIVFDYRLYPGKARTKNAIKLLDFMDYPREIIAHAQRMAEDFETTRKWGKY